MVVDGFDALDGYTEACRETDAPNPTVFLNAVSYDGAPLAVVQYRFHSAFDQFTTNFHWHDWEVLHVFVDTGERSSPSSRTSSDDNETGEPVLHVASSCSRKVPNDEFFDPGPERTPLVLAELGSHSSALSLNDAPLDGRDAVYVHCGGACTTEVRDSEGALGAFRINPDPANSSREELSNPRTGTEPLARFVADVASETAADARAVSDGGDSGTRPRG
jgi:hypothetical protein